MKPASTNLKKVGVVKNQGLVISLVVSVLVIIGLSLFIIFVRPTNQNVVTPTPTQTVQVATATQTAVPTGFIEGSLTYPSEGIPTDLTVYAQNTSTGKLYSTAEHITNNKFLLKVGYKLAVPVGSYYVYGSTNMLKDNGGKIFKAYYNDYVKCGMSVNCKSTAKIIVNVQAGKTTSNITIGDWYN